MQKKQNMRGGSLDAMYSREPIIDDSNRINWAESYVVSVVRFSLTL